jgi:hypothetical protein
MTSLRHALWAVGPRATAEILEWSRTQPPGLSLSLDPGDVLIPSPLREGDRVTFAAFLLSLAEAATELAETLDPDGMPAPAEGPDGHCGRHVLVRDEFGDSGGGHL